MSKYRKHTLDFKKEAVSLGDRLGSDAEAGRQLGLAPSSIHQWRKKMGSSKGFKSQEVLDPAAELSRLQRENSDLKKVNEILKRAAAFFSQDHLK